MSLKKILEFRADLHCHSTCSDGSMTPRDLVKHAKEIGLSALSITDHDTVEAYKEAIPQAVLSGIELMTGVEFSAHYGEESVHILGYNFALDSPELSAFCHKHATRRENRNLAILEKLAKRGIVIDMKDLIINPDEPPRSVGRPHIANALVKRGYCRNIRAAFNDYIAEGKSCFDPGVKFSVEETIKVIHAAHGLAVIAHPHLIGNDQLVEELTTLPFDGIEVYYARFSEPEVQKWKRLAESKHLMMTGGSDFHGSVKPTLPLGASWVSESLFRALHGHS